MPPRLPLALLVALTAAARAETVSLAVDASDAPRKILHAHLVIPARPGPLALLYPKWIPGEHGPTGDINALAGLRMSAGGRPLAWRRDPLDLYRFLIDVPEGADAVEVSLDYLPSPSLRGFTSGASLSPALAVINWHQLLLYPEERAGEPLYAATLALPAGWRFATALPVAGARGDAIAFAPTPLTTLVDSPVLAGANLRRVPLAPDHEIDLAGDSESALALPDAWRDGLGRLPGEARALFGGRHFHDYRFLVALSDHLSHFGLEHHASSDDRLPERTFSDGDLRALWVRLLPHEYAHAWNGKYRRPAQQTFADFQQPRRTDLLWVYEGLTSYLGDVLAVRSGLWPAELLRERLAELAAETSGPGRAWRPLVDTAVSAQALYEAPAAWASWRRTVSAHDEGELVWLEVDAQLRRLTRGARSLDDFCARFFGGDGGPEVAPYTLDDVVAALARVAPYDWRAFFAARVEAAGAPAPVGGIEAAGWRLAFDEAPNRYARLVDGGADALDLRFSLGLKLADDGEIVDVVPGSAAARAGLAPGGQLVAVDRRRFTPARLRDALARAGGPLDLLVETDGWFEDRRLDREPPRAPHLARDPSRPDLLAAILAPRR